MEGIERRIGTGHGAKARASTSSPSQQLDTCQKRIRRLCCERDKP